jgi:hypothetical protein
MKGIWKVRGLDSADKGNRRSFESLALGELALSPGA